MKLLSSYFIPILNRGIKWLTAGSDLPPCNTNSPARRKENYVKNYAEPSTHTTFDCTQNYITQWRDLFFNMNQKYKNKMEMAGGGLEL
jgi:hypothetical protein